MDWVMDAVMDWVMDVVMDVVMKNHEIECKTFLTPYQNSYFFLFNPYFLQAFCNNRGYGYHLLF